MHIFIFYAVLEIYIVIEMRYSLIFIAILLSLATSNVVYAYVVNTDQEAFTGTAVLNVNNVLYLIGANNTGPAIVMFNGFRVGKVVGIATQNVLFYDAIYYNNYIYVVSSDGYLYRYSLDLSTYTKGPKLGVVATAITTFGSYLAVTAYDYDASNSYYKIVIHLVDPSTLSIVKSGSYDYSTTSHEIPLGVKCDSSRCYVIGYTRGTDNVPYPLFVVFNSSLVPVYIYRYTSSGYGAGVDLYNGNIVIGVGTSIYIINSTDYSTLKSFNIGYQIAKLIVNGSRIWFSYNEDNQITGYANTFVSIGYIDIQTNSIVRYDAGYGRVYVFGKPSIFSDVVVFGGSARGNTLQYTTNSIGGMFIANPATYLYRTVTKTNTLVYMYTATKTVTTTQYGPVAPSYNVALLGGLIVMFIIMFLAIYIIVKKSR